MIETSTLTHNFTNATTLTTTNITMPFSDAWVVASTCILVIFFVFGIVANGITIAAIYSSPRLTCHYFSILLSIGVSDIVSAFVSVLFLYRRTWGFEHFGLPTFFCRLYWGLDLWTSFSTALHILSFAVLRLIGVHWPFKFQKITSTYMKLWIGGIWIVTFLCGFIPHFLFNTVNDIDRVNDLERAHFASCSLSPNWISVWQVYVQFAYVIFLFTPALSIIGISIAIALLLKHRRSPGDHQPACVIPERNCKLSIVLTKQPDIRNNRRIASNFSNGRCLSISLNGVEATRKYETATERRWRKDKQAIYQLFLIVGSFLLGYIPLTAFHFYTGFNLDKGGKKIHDFDWNFAMIQYLLLRFSECLNPVFYNMASRKMREETIMMFKRAFHISSSSQQNHQVQRLSRQSTAT